MTRYMNVETMRDEPVPETNWYALAVDVKLSGWGPAAGKTCVDLIPCLTEEDAVFWACYLAQVTMRDTTSLITPAIMREIPPDADDVLYCKWPQAAIDYVNTFKTHLKTMLDMSAPITRI